MLHEYVFVQSDGSCGMQPKSAPMTSWDLENHTKVVGETSWTCETRKCKPLAMCYKCICYSGQRYYDFFGWGTYNPPEDWEDD